MKITVENLWYRYSPEGHDVLRNVSFEIESGAYWAVLGPNGSGKTTALKLLVGLLGEGRGEQGIRKGQIYLDGKPLQQWGRRALAQHLAFVPGGLQTDFPLSVREFIVQGRFPHGSQWLASTKRDFEIADHALAKTGLQAMAEVPLMHLSAGERQLALMARALAQEPKVLLLDETTANLDLHFQLLAFRVLSELNAAGTSIVIVCHDLNLASEFSPNALWLKNGEVYGKGSMEQTFSTETIHSLYPHDSLRVDENPFTGKPKVFYSATRPISDTA